MLQESATRLRQRSQVIETAISPPPIEVSRTRPAELNKTRVSTFKPLNFPPAPPVPKSPDDSPPACPTPDYYSDNSLTDQSIETSHIVKSSILKFEEKHKTTHVQNPVQKTVTFGQNSTKEITPIKNLVRASKNVEAPKNLKNSYVMADRKIQDLVEMQSIESYELTEPKQVAPKPPPVYFQPPSRNDLKEQGSPSETKKRTTVIKITEYPTERRREPSRLDFLHQSNESDKVFDSELASTLSRSNLRNKMDAFANKPNSVVLQRNGTEKTAAPVSRFNGFHATPVIPTEITENHLSNVKKTLKTFERNSNNTVVVKIPKRN